MREKKHELRKLFATMSINNTDVKLRLDSGATCNFITSEVFPHSHSDTEITQTNASKALPMYNDITVKPIGQRKMTMQNPKNGRRYLVNFKVLPDSSTPILVVNQSATREH